MSYIKKAISSVLGEDSSWKWSEHLRQATFRGIPFGVVSAEGVFGRRQAIHLFPYRDQSWVEDMGRSNRRITIKGFLIQDSLVYDAPDVITQRNNLIAACEEGKAGTLIHPTLGELTVSVTESGLRINESAENGRVFEFDLTVIESGIKVFAVTENENNGGLTSNNWLKTASTTTAKYLALIKGEIRSATQIIKTAKQTTSFWSTMAQSTLNQATNFSNTLNSTFGSQKYGRYKQGKVGGFVSGATGRRILQSAPTNDRQLIDKTLRAAIVDREKLNVAMIVIANAKDIENLTEGIQDVFTAIINMALSIEQKMQVLNTLSRFQNLAYQESQEAKRITVLTNMLLTVMAASALAMVSGQSEPQKSSDAAKNQRLVCDSLTHAMTVAGDLALDDIYQELLDWQRRVITHFTGQGSERGGLAAYNLPTVLPALSIANRLYQDAGRSDELVMELNPRHPAFMPTQFKALKK